jgi:chorismate dehydratase
VSALTSGPADAPTEAHVGAVDLGVIDYLNVRPVYDWLLTRQASGDPLPGLRTHVGVPAEMNRALAAGAIDCSNVSSFAFGAHAGDWVLLPGLSVAAHGKVESVLLFSWHEDWRTLDAKSIAVSSHSATSVELVRVLCERRYGARPRFDPMPPDLAAMLRHHDAALIIGDLALVEYHRRRSLPGRGQPFAFDLAAEWRDWTGLPFVFAVWAARADRLERVRASGVVELLHASTRHGLERLERIAAEYAPRLDLPAATCLEYLRLLDYRLTEQELLGLRTFLELALPAFSWQQVQLLEA